MHLHEVEDRTGQAQQVLQREFGTLPDSLGIMPGTGWDKGLEHSFKTEAEVPYDQLSLPGVITDNADVPGHKKSIRRGIVNGRPALAIGRVHPNEWKDADISLATRIVMGAVKDVLDGVIVTHGVGTLHGRIGVEQGFVQSLIRTAIIDSIGYAFRGRRQQRINVGDVAIIENVITSHIGTSTPLMAGEFVDFYHDGIHRDHDRYFDLASQAVAEVQGKCARANHGFVLGPQFESILDKLALRAMGGDVVGMSGTETLLATRWNIPYAQLVLATNGPFAAHSHEGNQDVGAQNAEKLGAILELLAERWPHKQAA